MGPSPSGCWTCKIRHRKCDLQTPSCRECKDRRIPCHGYGSKPSWMDGADAEKQELVRIKKAVKKNFRNLRKAQNRERQLMKEKEKSHGIRSSSPLVLDESPSTAPNRLVTPLSSRLHSRHRSEPSSCNRTEPRCGSQPTCMSPDHCHDPIDEGRSPSASPRPQHPTSTCVLKPESASLLMHYLDYVFYWQYPYFQRRTRLGNRGWLLLFLSHGGPLYHAVLALSALHRNKAQVSQNQDYLRNQEAFEYHSKALRELREFSRRFETDTLLADKSRLAEFAASSLMLISFEVFNGAEYDWLPHLDAVITVLSLHSPDALLGQNASPNETDLPQHSGNIISNNEQTHSAFEFLIIHAIWFDILACVSTGRVPQIAYRHWLETSNIEMADLMGCYNWVMISIGDLAHLQAWKKEMKERGTLSVPDLVTRSREIEARLQTGIGELEPIIKLKPNSYPEQENTEASQATWVSYIFALASLALSGTIVSGPWSSVPEIREKVDKAVDVLRDWPRSISLQGLVWPLCVIGCLAESQHYSFFESLLSNLVEECGGFGNIGTVLKIVKSCWESQQQHQDREGLNLSFQTGGVRVLLI
ncbi:fungal-specific transcription factor domain-containing protein [Mariannaea sp. PMI_226]|nr:fungal-specific transcription factor domain-containing protein [Mariannaea sp. PMI_226]